MKNYSTMTPAEHAADWAEANGWSIPLDDFLVCLQCHLEATQTGDTGTLEFVELFFEECNFHTESKLFKEHKYAAALANYLGE